MTWQQNGTDLPSEEPSLDSIDTGKIWRRAQRMEDQKEIDDLKGQNDKLKALLVRVLYETSEFSGSTIKQDIKKLLSVRSVSYRIRGPRRAPGQVQEGAPQ
jgi:hypothetical protein